MKRITKLGLICIMCPAQERWEESLYRLLENILEKFKSINFNDICMTYVHSTTSMKNNWSFYCSKKWFSSVIAMVGSSALMWYYWCSRGISWHSDVIFCHSITFLAQWYIVLAQWYIVLAFGMQCIFFSSTWTLLEKGWTFLHNGKTQLTLI